MTEDSICALTDHVLGVGYDDLPVAAVRAAKIFLLDAFGVGVAGSAEPWAGPLIDSISAQGKGDDARVWVRGTRLPAAGAAQCNAYQMHNSEFDCIHEEAVVHAMTVPLAAAMAHAEGVGGIDGRALITAAVFGVDVAVHLGVAANAPLRFFRPATAGAFGAVAALGKLRGFDRGTLVNAFGIVLAQLSGTMQAHVDGGIMLGMQMGFNARNAVVACDMAARGLAAPAAVLDGEFGYFRLFEGNYDLRPCLDILGKTWRITEVAHKPFPSGRATHGVLDGLLALQKTHDFNADDVDDVVCRVPSLTRQLVGRPVLDVMEVSYARLSAPYVLASGLINRGLGVDDFRSHSLLEEARLALGRRITVEADDNPDMNALTPVTVVVTLKDGATHKITMDVIYGNPAKPMTRDAHLDKFRRNWAGATPPLGDQDGERLIELVDRLEDVADVRQLVDLMVAGSS